jgi:hypothetical protein
MISPLERDGALGVLLLLSDSPLATIQLAWIQLLMSIRPSAIGPLPYRRHLLLNICLKLVFVIPYEIMMEYISLPTWEKQKVYSISNLFDMSLFDMRFCTVLYMNELPCGRPLG